MSQPSKLLVAIAKGLRRRRSKKWSKEMARCLCEPPPFGGHSGWVVERIGCAMIYEPKCAKEMDGLVLVVWRRDFYHRPHCFLDVASDRV